MTNDPQLYERVLTLSNHGRARNQTKQFWPDMVGFKYKMSNIQAAIGCAQLERIEALIEQKRNILTYYRNRFASYSVIQMNPEPAGTVNGAWMPTAVFDAKTGVTCAALQEEFKSLNIDARVFFSPLSSLPMFEDQKQNVNAWSIPERAINLPSYHELTPAQQDAIADVVIRQLT